MNAAKKLRIRIRRTDSWWCAVCPELGVSGFGNTKDDAVESVSRSIRSTLTARAHALRTNPEAISQLATLRVAGGSDNALCAP